jgi:hypothetical protein
VLLDSGLYRERLRRAKMIEVFIAKNWRTLLLIVGVLLAIFVWPTLYRPLPKQGSILMRENRITGEIQRCRPDGYGEWY